jgi:hypothetical protein
MKLRLGLFENPYGDPTTTWTALADHNIVLNAARKSITLVKNNGVLPLKLNSGDNLVVAGPRATWVNNDFDPNVIWQSIYYSDPYAVNYLVAFQNRSVAKGVNVYLNDATNPKVAIVIIGEQGYTHGTEWANQDLNFPADQVAVLQGFKNRGIPVVAIVITPRPYVLTNIAAIADAIMLVYRGGTEIEQATAELCYGDYLPSGKLPFQMPRSTAQIGTDVTTNQVEKWDLPYDIGATDAQRTQIRNYIANNQAVPSTFGDPLYPYGWGILNWTDLKNAETDENQKSVSGINLELYPNPANNIINVNCQNISDNGYFEIFNISGRLVMSGAVDLNGRCFSININDIENGQYILKLSSGDYLEVKAFIKN